MDADRTKLNTKLHDVKLQADSDHTASPAHRQTNDLNKKVSENNSHTCDCVNKYNDEIGSSDPIAVDLSAHKKVLVTGVHSYIGQSFAAYAREHYPNNFDISFISVRNNDWLDVDFSQYDAILHAAGIAHADVGNVSEETKQEYYAVNTDLTIEIAKKAKTDGIKQFIFMSSMIIYGESAGYGKTKMISKNTKPSPANFYGDSKWRADKGVRALAADDFNVAVIRPPMIYGKGSKGNYPTLSKIAKKLPIFPNVNNERSMLHIDNLGEFLCKIILAGNGGIFTPQNRTYTKTADMVKMIAEVSGKNIAELSILNPAVWIGSKIPGKIGGLVNKAFGNMTYDHDMSVYEGLEYQIVDLKESVLRTEGKPANMGVGNKPKALILASVASMIDQFNMQNIQLLIDNGYQVDVVCNCKTGNTISEERVQSLISILENKGVSVIHVPIPRKITDIKGIASSLSQVKRMCNDNRYTLLHCHSPIGSVVARLAAMRSRKKYGTKVIYTAHGFHFYKGAPKQNWAIFYPIEKLCSRFTDVLITINREDYTFAQNHMKAGQIAYIPGVGVDTDKFKLANFDIAAKRNELGINNDDLVLLSVGELNQNKNHETVLRSIAKLENSKIHYFIAGQGDKDQHLLELASELGVNLHLLGYRTDVVELLNAADVFVFPSYREGLSVALMEAMASGLPCIASAIRGNVDLIDAEGGYLFQPTDVEGFSKGIELLSENAEMRHSMGEHNSVVMNSFSVAKVNARMEELYFRRNC